MTIPPDSAGRNDGGALTDEEREAIAALEQLAKRWPQTLMLLSYDSSLSVIHTADLDAIAGDIDRRADDDVEFCVEGEEPDDEDQL